jgi:photosystem II stability/assembly factor-like uncharacterized protein
MKSCLCGRFAITLLLQLIVLIECAAQWVQMSDGLEGGSISSILVDGSTVFVGRVGVYRSTDNGVSWTSVSNGLLAGEGRLLAGSSANLFVGTRYGVFRSVDQGATWTRTSTTLNEDVRSLVVKGSKVFAGTSTSVFVSDNNGESWTLATNGLPSNSSARFLYVNGNSLYVSMPSGIYESINDGQSWQMVGSSIGGSFPIIAKGNALYIGWGGQVLKSENTSGSWSSWINVSNGMAGVSDVLSLTLNGDAILAGTNKGILESTDDGGSWHALNTGIPDNISAFSLAVNGDNLFAGTTMGMYHSNNDGVSWTSRNSQLTNPQVSCFVKHNDILFAGTDCGVFKSIDGGSNWSRVSEGLSGFAVHIRAMATDGSFVYIGTQDGVFRSDDNGGAWEQVNNGLPSITLVNGLLEFDGELFVGVHLGGLASTEVIFKSTNNGQTWTPASGGLPSNTGVTSMTAGGGLLFASINGNTFSSNDKGNSWNLLRSGILQTNVFEYEKENLYAAWGSIGLFKSGDGGVTWENVVVPFNPFLITSLESHGENLYLGLTGYIESVYFSSDNGVTWIPADIGISPNPNRALFATEDKLFGAFWGDRSIRARSFSDFTSKILSFTPTSGTPGTTITITGNNFSDDMMGNVVLINGVSSTVTSSTATTINAVVPNTATTGKITVTANGQTVTSAADFTVEEMVTAISPGLGENAIHLYPNPSSDLLNVSFINALNTSFTLRVYSSTGGLVRIIQDHREDEITLDIASLEPGMYFLEIAEKDKLHYRRFFKL